MTDLGTLPGGFGDSSAFGFDSNGEIVGFSFTGVSNHPDATLWSNGVFYHLNDLLDPSNPLSADVWLSGANAINESGQILARAWT